MQTMINAFRPRIAALCRRFHVHRLDVFGSAARDDFNAERSDVDFLVEFEPDNPLAGVEGYFGFEQALEDLFGRTVDLVVERRVKNPYLRRSIEQTRQNVFSA